MFFLSLHWQHFLSIFSFVVLLLFLLIIVSPPIISLRFFVHLKGIIGSSSKYFSSFFVYLQNKLVFFCDLVDVSGRSVLRYCQRYMTDIVVALGFMKNHFSWDITCLLTFSFMSSALYPCSTNFCICLADSSSNMVIVEHIRFSLMLG